MKKSILSIFVLLTCASALTCRAENIGVPSECEDVMLQVFYWDSYKTQSGTDSKYGRTKWIDLLKDTAAINANFDLVWFPPSASGGGVGYTHKQLSDQNGDWGTSTKLKELIAALHAGNTKVLADIVINHRGNKSNWCDFKEDNFGSYGSFQLTQQHICKGDEGFTDKSSSCYGASASERGAADTGSNFDGARDLDHTSEFVQNWAKAYVQWMINVMKYDGFRYDMTLGYHGRYLSMYNEASNPYLSVSELWEGITRQKQHLEETNYNTMIFDFQQKYELHKAIVGGSYSKLMKNSNSFRGQNLEKYAVTFIDNHDTFERDGYGNNQFGGQYCDLDKETVKANVLQAYAYILSMPGVPCVFWPHWYKYKDEINKFIKIRKLAGIHSESAVSDESYSQYNYSGTIQGKKHKVILRLGKNRDMSAPAGYGMCANGDHYSVYVEGVQGLEEVTDGLQGKGEKFLDEGKLFIRVGEDVYDLMGRKINK